MIAIVLQFLQIILQNRVFPHTCVHSWSKEHRSLRGHNGRGEHIITDATCHLTNHIGSTWCHHKEVTSFSQRYMFHVEIEVAIEGIDDTLIVRQGLKGHRGDELRGVLCHDHMHICIQLHQHRCQIGNLIGSNATRHA